MSTPYTTQCKNFSRSVERGCFDIPTRDLISTSYYQIEAFSRTCDTKDGLLCNSLGPYELEGFEILSAQKLSCHICDTGIQNQNVTNDCVQGGDFVSTNSCPISSFSVSSRICSPLEYQTCSNSFT